MNDDQIRYLLHNLESDLVERKASFAEKDKIYKDICAFSNDFPDHRSDGVIFIGVHNDGSCASLPITEQLMDEIAQIPSNGKILPIPSMTLQRHTIDNCEFLAIKVSPNSGTPVRFDGRTWIRIGAVRHIASIEQERILTEKRRSKDISFDASPIQSSNQNDLNIDIFKKLYLPHAVNQEILAENNRSLEQQMSSLRILSSIENPTPTVAGMLALGKEPHQFLAGAYIQFVRYEGFRIGDPIKDEKVIIGSFPFLIPEIESILRLNISTSVDITSKETEVRHSDYPLVALQQIVRNAVLHRNYQTSNAPVRVTWFNDRIEIQSPGGPFGQVTIQNFGTPGLTDYRNPLIAETMKVFGFVQKFGAGIGTAKRALEQNGNPNIEFKPENNYVLVTIKKRP